jgi:hypothetical protein
LRRAAALAAALAAVAVSPAPAAAATPDPVALAARIAAPWPAQQLAAGAFPDYMDVRRSTSRDKYGVAALGYGLLQTGIATGDPSMRESGLRALVRSALTPRPYHSIAFEKVALAAGWNLARVGAPGSPTLAAAAGGYQSRLVGMKPTWIGQNRAPYFNQYLVDAVTVLELARAGLPKGAAGTVAGDPAGARTAVVELLRDTLPKRAGSQTTRTRAGIVSVAIDGPLAYHALTLAYLARAIELLGPAAPARARRLLDRYARASWLLTAPDGDLAWFGRSHEQAWALPLTAYGMQVAAAGAGRGWAPRYRAVAGAALTRLATRHVGGAEGLHITPAFARDPSSAVAAADGYVSGPAYTGLTLQALGWLAERVRGQSVGSLAGAGAAVLGRGSGAFAVASTGRVWFAVRSRPGTVDDLRAGAGIVALKVRDTAGRWRDALPQRPRTSGREDSVGPSIDGALPYGRAVRLGRGPSVRWDVEFRAPGFGRLKRRALVIVRPTRCGVRFRVPARGRERARLSAFFPAAPKPARAGKRAIVGGNLRLAYRGAGHAITGGSYLSAIDGRLVRTRVSTRGAMVASLSSRGACR